MARGYYINYIFEYSKIFEKIEQYKYNKINFFIDLQSISTGFYNKDTILVEIGKYAENNQISDLLFTEFYNFLENLYHKFKKYDPHFITFFDDGKCLQNKSLSYDYKKENSIKNIVLLDNEHLQLFKDIKKYYFQKIHTFFNRHISTVYYLKEYEADFIPFYCLQNNLFDSSELNVINIILSKDKDLLQCCQYKNTYQIVNVFKRGLKKSISDIYDDNNAISYIYKKFKYGILTAKHIPWILALSGDEADGIIGIKQVGPATAVKILEGMTGNMPNNVNELLNLHNLKKLPKIISDNIDTVALAYKLASFEEQLKRVSPNFLKC